MLSAKVVIKKLSRRATSNEHSFNFFACNVNKPLVVRSVYFDDDTDFTKHGVFHLTVQDGHDTHVLFTYNSEVDFELYIGGNKLWPKQ